MATAAAQPLAERLRRDFLAGVGGIEAGVARAGRGRRKREGRECRRLSGLRERRQRILKIVRPAWIGQLRRQRIRIGDCGLRPRRPAAERYACGQQYACAQA